MKSQFNVQMVGDSTIMNLYGPIGESFGGISASEVVSALGDSGDRKITAHINTPGGSLKDGIAIYNRFRGHPGKVRTIVDAAAWSAGSIVMLGGDDREMLASSRGMMHNAHLPSAGGDGAKLIAMGTELNEQTASAAKIYGERTNLSETEAAALMDAETWFGVEDGFKMGFTTIQSSDAPPPKADSHYDAAMLALYKNVPTDIAVEQEISNRRSRDIRSKLKQAKRGGHAETFLMSLTRKSGLTAPELAKECGAEVDKIESILDGRVDVVSHLILRGFARMPEMPSYDQLVKAATEDGIKVGA